MLHHPSKSSNPTHYYLLFIYRFYCGFPYDLQVVCANKTHSLVQITENIFLHSRVSTIHLYCFNQSQLKNIKKANNRYVYVLNVSKMDNS